MPQGLAETFKLRLEWLRLQERSRLFQETLMTLPRFEMFSFGKILAYCELTPRYRIANDLLEMGAHAREASIVSAGSHRIAVFGAANCNYDSVLELCMLWQRPGRQTVKYCGMTILRCPRNSTRT